MPISGKIMTFDLAARTGYAVGEPDFVPTFSHHQFESTGDNYGRHQANVRAWLTHVIRRELPVALIGYEQPSIFGVTQPATVIKLCSYASTIEEICLRENLNVPVRQINPSQVKKFWTGSGRAKKPDMVERARKLGFMVDCDDEADALACWYWMIECYGDDAQRRRFEQMRYEVDMGRQQKVAF
jgi:Holliday junction resolvasome RuvABC endonuclease subunit